MQQILTYLLELVSILPQILDYYILGCCVDGVKLAVNKLSKQVSQITCSNQSSPLSQILHNVQNGTFSIPKQSEQHYFG